MRVEEASLWLISWAHTQRLKPKTPESLCSRLCVNLLVEQRDSAPTRIGQASFFNKRRVFVDPIFDAVRDEARFERSLERPLKYDGMLLSTRSTVSQH